MRNLTLRRSLRQHRLPPASETRSCGDCLPDWRSTHLYAAEAIETEAKKRGWWVKVETVVLLARVMQSLPRK